MKMYEIPVVSASRNESRGNLDISFECGETSQRSERWTMGSFAIEFVYLGKDAALHLNIDAPSTLAKVITGSLIQPARSAFCEPRGLQDTRLPSPNLTAGSDGALIALIALPDNTRVNAMSALSFSGPHADALIWRRFSEQYGQITDAFEGADAYIGPGFRLLNADGEEITYLNLWTAGKGVDLTTHNHGHPPSDRNPAFAETHLVLSNGTGKGGMYACSKPGASRTRYPVPTGFEHGPFFDFNEGTGKPVLLDNGAVKYPWHGWQAGDDHGSDQAYDVVAAFETTVAYTRV